MPTVAQDPRQVVLGRVRELPPLPLVVQELLAVMRRPESSADDITRVLGADQALAGKILRLVNSSFYGMPGHVGTISQAVVILGHAALRNLAMSLAVVDSIGRELPPERRQVFWQHALATAAGSEVVARHTGLADPEEAFVAGLLHDIGHLILAIALPAGFEAAADAGVLGDTDRERDAIGMDHCRAGRLVLQHWRLPSSLIECVRLHHSDGACQGGNTPHLTIVALADRLARLQGDLGESSDVTADVIALAATVRLAPEDVIGLLPTIASRFDEARSVLGAADLDLDWTSETFGMFPPNGLPVVVLSRDRRRAEWLERLAERHGYEPADAALWLADGHGRQPVLAILDIASYGEADAAQLAATLSGTDSRVLVPRPGDAARVSELLDCRCGALPMVFSVGELVF